MTTKTKTAPRVAGPAPVSGAPPGPWSTPPWTLEERLRRIEAMGQNIDGYVKFMCQVVTLNSASGEVKERAVTAFYEQMVVVVKQLGRIQEDLRLE